MKAVDAGTNGTIRLRPSITVPCPYDHAVDEYQLVVEYRPRDHAVELQSFADYLAGFDDRELSQEQVAETVYTDLRELLNPAELSVTVRGEHYGIPMEVLRS